RRFVTLPMLWGHGVTREGSPCPPALCGELFSGLQKLVQLRLRRGVEAEEQLLARKDDRPPQPRAVLRQPGEEPLALEAFGLGAALGRDELARVAGERRERL